MHSDTYEVIVLGAGLSGLAAAIRLAHFGKKVAVLESHNQCGGLNSWYERDGRIYDTGLHAFTNFASTEDRVAPLNRVLRQLRLRREDLGLCPQGHSRIRCGETELELDNDFAAFKERIATQFPKEYDGFLNFLQCVEDAAYKDSQTAGKSAGSVLAKCISSPELRALLCLPVFFFGNAWRGAEMPFGAFATLFKSIFVEGLARPRNGMKPVIDLLETRLNQAGATLKRKTQVVKVVPEYSGQCLTIYDNSGQKYQAGAVISTIGAVETRQLLDTVVSSPAFDSARKGTGLFVEALFAVDEAPATFGLTDCMQFLGFERTLAFRPGTAALSSDALLVCVPDNYQGVTPTRLLRLSAPIADFAPFHEDLCGSPMSSGLKSILAQQLLAQLGQFYPRLAGHAKFLDLYTPYTFRRFTGHANGAIYGSPDKFLDGETGVPDLLLAGTDQGLMGIVGALLSGILAANRLLKAASL